MGGSGCDPGWLYIYIPIGSMYMVIYMLTLGVYICYHIYIAYMDPIWDIYIYKKNVQKHFTRSLHTASPNFIRLQLTQISPSLLHQNEPPAHFRKHPVHQEQILRYITSWKRIHQIGHHRLEICQQHPPSIRLDAQLWKLASFDNQQCSANRMLVVP